MDYYNEQFKEILKKFNGDLESALKEFVLTITEKVINDTMKGELRDFLSYDKYHKKDSSILNSRNGYY